MPPERAEPAPVVSVIMPVYNEMPHLREALESALAQDMRDLELIVVDDGSTDGSGELLDDFAERDDRVTVLHERNSGWPGTPRNRGLDRAHGEFVFFLDGDDTLDPRALREMLEMTQKSDSPEPVDVVIPRLRGTGGRRIVPLFLRHPHGDIELGRAMETLTPQKLIRRKMIERHGLRFPEGEVRLEDGIFMTRAYVRARRIAYCGQRTLYFFAAGRGENISSRSFRPAKYVDSCRVIAGTLREGIPDQDRATRLIAEFFGRQGLRFYTPRRWRLTHPLRRREWVSLHRAFLRDLVPPASDAAHVHPTDRRKIALLRDGDLRGMNRLVRAERRLAHLATLTGSAADDGALDLIVELAPQTRRPLFGEGSTATLLLAGYRSSAETAITGERVDAEGPHRFRFRLPLADVLRYGGDRVAMWTLAGDGRAGSGSRVRIVSASPLDETRAGVRILSAGQAGVSLDLRS